MKIFQISKNLEGIYIYIYICCFVDTYPSEQAFSSMKQIKDKQWSCLTDCNLKNLGSLATTKLQPGVDKLAGVKQRQKTRQC
jgi:hypothetical protein